MDVHKERPGLKQPTSPNRMFAEIHSTFLPSLKHPQSAFHQDIDNGISSRRFSPLHSVCCGSGSLHLGPTNKLPFSYLALHEQNLLSNAVNILQDLCPLRISIRLKRIVSVADSQVKYLWNQENMQKCPTEYSVNFCYAKAQAVIHCLCVD